MAEFLVFKTPFSGPTFTFEALFPAVPGSATASREGLMPFSARERKISRSDGVFRLLHYIYNQGGATEGVHERHFHV
jgi:hypothetical protein